MGESYQKQQRDVPLLIPLLRLKQQDRDWVVPSKLAVLKYVHALPCTTQCESVKEQSRACGAGIFFVYDQRSGWTWTPDKDAVCGPMPVWCPPAWPVGGVNIWGIIFIHPLPQFILVNTRVSQAVLPPNVITNDRWRRGRFPGLKLPDVDIYWWCFVRPHQLRCNVKMIRWLTGNDLTGTSI